MTNLEAIKQMSVEELAFFLSVTRWDDLNSIHMIPKEDIDYFTEYLNKDGSELVESVKSLHDSSSNDFTSSGSFSSGLLAINSISLRCVYYTILQQFIK